MARYREQLPQLGGELLITDGGIETDLIFNEGLELPHFATFPLLRSEDGLVGADAVSLGVSIGWRFR